ncbi:MAG: hypothetical protein LUH04_07155 [Clostridium sp.]|nr:hypothetical protein [Clostridium sp.]
MALWMQKICKNLEKWREYVGGDAYNFIIGASLVGAKVSGVTTTKAIYISAGLIIFCMGLNSLPITTVIKENEKKNQIEN